MHLPSQYLTQFWWIFFRDVNFRRGFDTGLVYLSLPLFTICKVEKNITSDTCSRSGNQTQFPLPETRVVPKLYVQLPWQKAPLDQDQAQVWGSEFFWRAPGFPPYLHLINSHGPPGAVQKEQLSKGSWHHTAHWYVSSPLAPSLLLLGLFRQNYLKLYVKSKLASAHSASYQKL